MSDLAPHKNSNSNSKESARIDRKIEIWLAPAVIGLPLIYWLTDRSWAPVLWNYSMSLLALIAIYCAFFAIFLVSYRWSVPQYVARARTLIVSVGFSIVVALVVTEGMLAILDDRPSVATKGLRGYAPDPDVGYVLLPNYEQEIVTADFTSHWQTNSQGIRADREFGPKPAGITRILALGDSFTMAVGVTNKEAWPGVLETHLNERNTSSGEFEVVNGGHAAYGTMQELNWYKKFGDVFNSDIVLVAMTPNDISDNGSAPPGYFRALDGYLGLRDSGRPELRLVQHRAKWYSLPGAIRRSYVWERMNRVSFFSLVGPKLNVCHIDLTEDEQRIHDLTENFLLELRDQVLSRGSKFGIILITFREQLGEMAPGYDPSLFGGRWTRFAQENGIPVIDTFDRARNHPEPQSLFWRWDDHYSQEGNKMTGEAAFDLVESMLSNNGT